MRGKVAVAVIVVLAGALFLVPYASANVGITWSVYPEEADFQSEFVYSITLTNPSSHEEVGELDLIVGSDYNNMDIRREWHVTKKELGQGSSCEMYGGNKIKIPAGGSCTFKTPVQFIHPDLKQGAFRDWTETENPESPKWLTTWYECNFTPFPFGDPVGSDKKMGEPILTRCIEEFKEHHVEQNKVYKDLSFDYSISLWANCEDSIELQVYSNTSPSGWDKQVLQNYTELDVETNNTKTLTWPAVNLTLDNFDPKGRGHYRFVGTINKSKTYSGPRIEERFEDPKVSYKKTINELFSFDYEVSVWIDQVKDSIVLKVYNYSLRDWESKGIRNYTTPGNYQPLKWESINLSRDYFDGNPLIGKYQFVGKYNTSKNNGYRIEEKFYKLRVTPTEGENNITFNYSVTVNANIYDKIELQVKNHTTTGLWDSKGTRDYTTPNINETLTWHNLQLNTHELNRRNDSMFRFEGKCGAKSSEEGLGLPIWPIRPFFRNNSVKPDRGLYNEKFNYNVDVKAEKNGTVNLSIFCPDGILLYEIKQDYNKAPLWQTLDWTVPNFNGCDLKTGKARYRFGFRYKGNEIINLTGEEPYIGIAKFGNETVEPEIGTEGTLFNYTINVTAAYVGDVKLLTKCPGETQWYPGVERKYDTPGIVKTLTWTRIELPCDNCGDAEYKFRFIQGDVPSEIYPGPELIIEEFGELFVTPKEGTCSTPFNFSIDFSTSKPGNVPVTLQVSLDEAAGDAYWEDVAIKRYEKDIPGSQIPVNFTVCMAENEVTENLASAWVTNKVIYWRVKGLVNVSSTIPTTYDINLTWYNLSVSPEEGWWYDPFSFKVSLSAIENGTVVLQVKLNGSDSDWQNRGKTYEYARSDQKSFTWLNEPICSDSFAGNTWYRFEFTCGEAPYYSNKSGLDGPKLFIPLNISFTDGGVEEKEDVIFSKTFGGLFNETDNTFFNFSINVTANDTTDVDLILVDPNNNSHPERDSKSYTEPPQQLPFTWTQKELPLAQIGNWCYTFSYNDPRNGSMRCNELFEGPRIIAVFKNYTIEPYPILFNRTHKVTVFVTGTIPMEVELEAFNLYKNKRIWESVGTTRVYEPPGEQPLNWTINTFDMPFDNLRLNWKRKENGE